MTKKKKTTVTQQTKVTNSISNYTKWWSNGNTLAVQQGKAGLKYPFFVVKTSLKLQAVSTYHWNNGQGVTPGKITLMEFKPEDANADGSFDTKKGNIFGPYQAKGRDYNRFWDIFPNITLSAGYYCVIDSEPDTWSYNSTSKNEGFADVYGEEGTETAVTTTPKPTAKATNTPVPAATSKPSATPKASVTEQGTPLPTLSPGEDMTESYEEHNSQPDEDYILPTAEPIGSKEDIGIQTSVSYSSGDINNASKKTAKVTAGNTKVTLGNVTVDYEDLNLDEDHAAVNVTLSTLSEKTDAKSGYSVKAWNLDTGSSEDYLIPVSVTMPYDSSVKDPEQELRVEAYNKNTGAWEEFHYGGGTAAL